MMPPMTIQMNISRRILLALALTGILCILAVTKLAISSASDSLQEANLYRLRAVRAAQQQQIEAYFSTIRHQIKTFSENGMVVEAMAAFPEAFHSLRGKVKLDLTQRDASLMSYYTGEFLPELQQKQPPSLHQSVETYIPKDEVVAYLQYHYISNNKHPRFSKHNLDAHEDGTAYADLHRKVQPVIRSYLEAFGYYDIFLLDHKTEHIVYSV